MDTHSFSRHFGIIRMICHIAVVTLLLSIMHVPLMAKIALFVAIVVGFAWLYRPPVISEPLYGPMVGSEDMAGPGPSEHP